MGDRHVHRSVLGDDVLLNLYRPRLGALLTRGQLLFTELQRVRLPCCARVGSFGSGARDIRRLDRPAGLLHGAGLSGITRVHVVRAEAVQDRARIVIAPVRFDGHYRSAALELLVVVARVLLGDTHPSERTQESPRRGAYRGAAQHARQQATGQHRADARNETGRQGAQHPTHDATGDGPLGGSSTSVSRILLRRLDGAFLVVGIADGDANLVVAKSTPLQFINRVFGVGAVVKDADNGGSLSCCHGSLPSVCVRRDDVCVDSLTATRPRLRRSLWCLHRPPYTCA